MKRYYVNIFSISAACLLLVFNSCRKDDTKLLVQRAQLDVRSAYYRALLLDAPSKYVTYDGTGAQRDLANYNHLSGAPTTQPASCPGSATLCWFRVTDVDQDEDIDAADFYASFDALDTDADGTLDDHSEVAGILEKKL
jgi:hypothetical protein